MAISNITSPVMNTPVLAYRPIIYKYSSDDVNIVHTIAEVLVNGVRISARTVMPDLGTTDEFTLDISDDVQVNLDALLKTIDSDGYLLNDGGAKVVGVKIYEVTLVGGVLVTTYDPDDANNSNYDYIYSYNVVCNWTESHLDYNGFSIEDYKFINSNNGAKFLSEAPLVKDIELGANEFLGLCYPAATDIKGYKLEIKTYNSANALLNTDYINVTEWDSGYAVLSQIIDSIYIDMCVGTQNLLNNGVSLTNVAWYTVSMVNSGSAQSEVRRFNIVGSCDTDVRFHFINKFGKQDSITLKGNKVEELQNASKTYQKALSYTYSSSNRGVSSFENTMNYNFVAYSKSIGRDMIKFASAMLLNNNAYVEIDGAYYPIIINTDSKVIVNEKNMPIQFQINYSFANPTKGIRG